MKTWDMRIKADTNDADYVTVFRTISDEDLAHIMPLLEAIKAFRPYKGSSEKLTWTHHHNFPLGEYSPREDLGEKTVQELYSHIDPDVLEHFLEYVPFGIHTIDEIVIAPASTWTRLV